MAEKFFFEGYHRDKTIKLQQFKDAVMMAIKHPFVAVPCVFVEGVLAGYAIVNYNADFQEEREGDLYQIYLDPQFRGTAASRYLSCAVTEQFDAWGCVDSHVWAAPGFDDNKKALAIFRNLWSKYGYEVSGIIMTRKGK